MARQVIDLDTPQSDGGRGDPPRTAFTKVNENDEELFQRVGDAEEQLADASEKANAAFPKTGGDINGPTVVYGTLSCTGTMQSLAYRCRAGSSGYPGGNVFNMMWGAGAMALWVDTTNLGNIAINPSDYRIKKDVEYVTTGDIEKVMAGQPCTWRYQDGLIWDDGGKLHRSFIAHELQAVDETLAQGTKDAVAPDGGIIPQGLEMLAIASVLWGALKEEITLRQQLELRVLVLEDRA
ncbi:tail fiber domain-containing protein [Xanthomonas axonopodis]|uniref:Peptidase S74 domain-containing protein n=1 Tax=Xanthomonas axonopodis pv. cajani TaxID=487827 RepID=A0ABX3M9A8_9XANT|nr:tail fiber domain-containing protein [Xanthomonas axonopodis]OOX08671.1 hypothetical protein Xcaj_18390 [Xanthomonas axonopodis pv. cajani]